MKNTLIYSSTLLDTYRIFAWAERQSANCTIGHHDEIDKQCYYGFDNDGDFICLDSDTNDTMLYSFNLKPLTSLIDTVIAESMEVSDDQENWELVHVIGKFQNSTSVLDEALNVYNYAVKPAAAPQVTQLTLEQLANLANLDVDDIEIIE